MTVTTWSAGDQKWATRYRAAMVSKQVPLAALHERERELRDAVRAAGLPAAELFGDAAILAAEDAAELVTIDEVVRTSEGGGLRTALRELGGTLLSLATLGILLMLIRTGWLVDIDVAPTLVTASVVVGAVGWVVGRALFSAGRPVMMIRVLLAVAAFAVGGIALAVIVGPGQILASDVSLPLLGVGMLAPGVLALVAASRMPQQALRTDWDNAAWLRRFTGSLRARLVPTATTRGHVADIERAMGAGTPSAFAEFGHPLVLARELADANRISRVRRWWVATVGSTIFPLLIAAAIFGSRSWEVLTIPVVALLLLSAVISLVIGWRERPFAKER